MSAVGWIKRTAAGLPRIFWYLWVGTLINRVGIFVVPFLTLFLTRHQGHTVEEATFVVSLYGLGSFTSQLVSGYLTDMWGRRPTMLLSLFATPVVLMLMSTLTNLSALALTTLLLGFFTDLYRPASSAIIADVVDPSDRPRAFSLRYWAINLGAAIGLSLAGWLASQNYLLLFIGDAVTTLAFGIVTLIYIPETKPPKRVVPPDLKPDKRLSFLTVLKNQFAGEEKLLQFALIFTALMLISASVYNQGNSTMPLSMQANNLTETDYGNVIALNGLVIVLVSLVVNQLLARRSQVLVMAGSALLIGSGFGLYAINTTKIAFATGVIVWTIGELMGSPIAPTIMADLAPHHRRGFYQSLIGASYGLAAFIGPIVGGAIYSNFGDRALWATCFAGGVVTALGHCFVIRPLYARLRRETVTVVLDEPALVIDA